MLGTTLIKRFEAYCPLWLAEPGDPCGLHIGTLDKPVHRVMVSLDVRPNVVQEAIEKKVDLLIVKHPPIFRPVARLTADNPQTNMYLELAKHEIAVYAAHTNMDIIHDGLNDWFCEKLGIGQTTYLTKSHEVKRKKLNVFVPHEASDRVRAALEQAGAGQIGNYSGASFSQNGTGRFTPEARAHPAIGQVAKKEAVAEEKIEVVLPETLEDQVVAAMLRAHPYEEVAYEVLTLTNQPEIFGIGRVGQLKAPVLLEEFIQQVKTAFQLEGLRVVYPHEQKEFVQTVAICGGSGEKFYPDAVKAHADVYITGDVYYHTAHDMQETGMTVLDPGHYIETLCKEKVAEKLNEFKKEGDWDVEIMTSSVSTNPFRFK
jgi:dinuclear metal center YbgI/SA1388 family protein